ncbi:MAG: TlpA family protein disulfide reductase [Actinobacteria bacterium]|nr:TlpA family protein disulfide reductase [Actinomycetota bacterium]MCI0677687.1 TlpA family protein disulfide reductase [Actinomycetota bacterium]
MGSPAPPFEVELLDGGIFALTRHLTDDGRPLVLNLWASWCVPCRTEMPDLSTFANAHPDIAVLGVAVEDRLESAAEFAEEIGVVYPLALGDQGFEASYPRLGLPVTYFIDANGKVTDVHHGLIDIATLEELTAG